MDTAMWEFAPVGARRSSSESWMVRSSTFGVLVYVLLVPLVGGPPGLAQTDRDSLAFPLPSAAGDVATGAAVAAVFGWTNEQSRVWRAGDRAVEEERPRLDADRWQTSARRSAVSAAAWLDRVRSRRFSMAENGPIRRRWQMSNGCRQGRPR
jgi:hypothetical protein